MKTIRIFQVAVATIFYHWLYWLMWLWPIAFVWAWGHSISYGFVMMAVLSFLMAWVMPAIAILFGDMLPMNPTWYWELLCECTPLPLLIRWIGVRRVSNPSV